MDNSCQTIKVLDFQGFDIVKENSDCSAYQAGRKLYDEFSNSTVLVETGKTPSPRSRESAKVGTGFFVNNGDEIVTNAHVAAVDPYVDVISKDGKLYHTKLEKLDDRDDLALLKVIGIEPDPGRAVKLSSTADLKKPDAVNAFGRPDGSDDLVYSPGAFLARGALKDLVPNPASFPDLAKLIKMGQETKDPVLAREIADYLDSERIHARINIHHANSGSPAVNDKGELEGVIADRISAAHSLMVPAERVAELLSRPESKYNFNYQTDETQNQKLVSITRKDGSSLPPVVLQD